MLRIALTGAHGTGKTTLIRALKSTLEPLGKLGFCREAPRLIIERVGSNEFFRRGNNTPTRQGLIFLEHVIEEQRRSVGCDILATDRTLIDHLAYTAVLFPEVEETPEFKVYRELSFESLQNYDAIFKLPVEFALVDDGVREDAQEFQSVIDRKIDEFYAAASISPHIVTGSVEDRAVAVLKRVRQALR